MRRPTTGWDERLRLTQSLTAGSCEKVGTHVGLSVNRMVQCLLKMLSGMPAPNNSLSDLEFVLV